MFEFIQVLLAFILADFLTAIYHLATDRGWNIRSQVAYFRNHHMRPWTMTFDLQPMAAGVPVFIAGLFWLPWFLLPLGVFLAFAQVPHYYAHFPAPRVIRWLQRLGVLLPPACHARHHHGKFDRDFCVISGWCNPLVNWLARRLPRSRT